MITTYEKLYLFDNIASKFLEKNKATDTKFHYALKKFAKQIAKKITEHRDEFLDKSTDIAMKYASVDKDNNILWEKIDTKDREGNILSQNSTIPMFTKDSFLKKEKEIKSLEKELLKKTVEVEPYFATETPSNLTDLELEAFEGFVIRIDEVVEEVK